jgi:hypothetical protein
MITLIIGLVILGVCLYLVEVYIPMAAPIKIIIRVIVVLFIVVTLLRVFGITDSSLYRIR